MEKKVILLAKDDDHYLALIYSSIIGSIATWAYIVSQGRL